MGWKIHKYACATGRRNRQKSCRWISIGFRENKSRDKKLKQFMESQTFLLSDDYRKSLLFSIIMGYPSRKLTIVYTRLSVEIYCFDRGLSCTQCFWSYSCLCKIDVRTTRKQEHCCKVIPRPNWSRCDKDTFKNSITESVKDMTHNWKKTLLYITQSV